VKVRDHPGPELINEVRGDEVVGDLLRRRQLVVDDHDTGCCLWTHRYRGTPSWISRDGA